MPLQDWIHKLEEGAGAKIIKWLAAGLAFVVVAAIYDTFAYQGFSSPEAMENAQLARNLAQGKGYVTDSIRPLDLYLLDRTEPGAAHKALREGVPDLTHPPAYPVVLAGLMKALPFQFTAKQPWFYAPERWLAVFNQALLFAAVVLLFRITRRLFDSRVAWLAAIVFAGTELFWRFSLSGLSTIFLEVIFLAMIFAMLALEGRARTMPAASVAGWAIVVGALAGLGALTRYAFGWVIVPAMLFCGWAVVRGRGRTAAIVFVSFAVVVAPWLARNRMLSGSVFGTSVYALVEETPPFQGETLERSLNPEAAFKQMRTAYLKEKMFSNLQKIVGEELPTMGGNWLCAFFLVGLLIPFRNPALRRLRYFLVAALLVFTLEQALGRTFLSAETPGLNTENMLVILAPLLFAYGAGLFCTLIDQLNLMTADVRGAAIGLFVVVACLPLALAALAPPQIPPTSPYAPKFVQATAHIMSEKELMMSDIPWAVAWYGQRPCLWLTLNDSDEFYRASALQPVQAVYLTQRTTDSRLLTELSGSTNSWGRFFWDCWAHGEVPGGFPLKKAPAGFLPDQMLVSDRVRW